MRPRWHYFVAAAITLLVKAAISPVWLAFRAAPNFVIISAHEYTQAARDAVASLQIPNLRIMETKLPYPEIGTYWFVQTVSVGITLAIFLIILCIIGRVSQHVARSNQALRRTASRRE